ncbi:MAG: neutral/alkaline non-lysosomal ceramidase N-terminal domain-containing protein [candidate division KSB1 bacterium]|nr:neutral/alkaline non-lysosomal ceramidase N-terminal domain-containing protein [candidate division KSB1 bacterium]
MKQQKKLLAVLSIAAAVLSCGKATDSRQVASDWQAGVAKVAITPDRPVWLAGYGRDTKSIGVHDDVWARALALNNGEKTVLIIATDLIGLFKNDVDDIRQQIVPMGADFDHIPITATHNHSGPDVLGLWNANSAQTGVDAGYLAEVKQKIVRVAQEALARLQPARLFFSQTEVQGISYNARDRDIIDYRAVTLHVKSTGDSTIATLVNFACHPEVLTSKNKLITSDYAHYLYQKLEVELGGTAMLVNGALGGMVTPLVSGNTFAEALRCGETLASAVIQSLQTAQPVTDTQLTSRRRRLKLKVDNANFLKLYEMRIISRPFVDGMVETEVGVLQIGPALAGTIPGEALPKIGLAIKDAMRAPYKMVIGLTNDELGYLIPSADWQPQSYEESMSLGREAGDAVRAAIIALLQEIEAAAAGSQ